nr:dihydroxyacetone kinase subunit DhaK [Streptomyces olivaceus]
MSYFLSEQDPVLAAARGLAAAHPDIVDVSEEPLYLLATDPSPYRMVALVSGGGGGHDPLHTGLLGRGGIDAVCPGQIYASPHNRQILAASRSALRAGGVLHIVKNYTGDVINFGIAAERLRADGVPVETVLVDDDVATDGTCAGRRGTAATVVVEKLLGAAADRGTGLAELAELGWEIAARSRSLAVCARAHTSPSTRRPAFTLPPDQIDFGVGIHGERGARTVPLPRVEDLVRRMLNDLLAALPATDGGLLLVVNGLGGTSSLELLGIADAASHELTARGEHVCAVLTGSHATALDMAGFSLTLTALRPDWLELWQAPAHTPLTEWPQLAAEPEPITARTVAETAAAPGSSTCLDRFTTIVGRVRDDLTHLDQLSGDGDFGANLSGGLLRARMRAQQTGGDGFTAAAEVFLDQVGGTSGPLFGLLFQHLGAVTTACPDGRRPAVPALAKALAQGTAAIRRVGGAGPGDRTLVDALLPAVAVLRGAGPDSETAVTDAALAAISGARRTDRMLGARGRSSYVGDKVLGVPDPGAIGVALLLVALSDIWEPQTAARLPAPGYIVQPSPAGT